MYAEVYSMKTDNETIVFIKRIQLCINKLGQIAEQMSKKNIPTLLSFNCEEE